MLTKKIKPMKTRITTLMAMFITCFMALNGNSQTIEWQKCFGGSNGEEAYSIDQTTDGGYIVAGKTRSNDGDVSGNHGSYDYWIVKLDAAGDTSWTKCLGGSSSDYARSIRQTNDGGYIIAGYSESNNGDVSGNHGDYDYWIVKLDAAGDTLWTKCLGGSSSDYAQSIRQTSDGGYIVAGTTWSNDGDVSGNHGSLDYWIVKLDAAGDTLWTKCLGGSDKDYAYSIQQTSDGGYIVAGYTYSNDGDVSGNHGSSDSWIVKLDAAGDTLWTKCLGGSSSDYARSIRQTSDGGYIIAGYSKSNDGDVSGNHGSYDYWIVKLDAAGDTLWTKCLGGSDHYYARSIQQTSDGGYIVAGSKDSLDYWIIKLNSFGDSTWTKCLGGSKDDYAQSIQQTNDGGYIIAGYSESNDGDVSGNHGGSDFWIVKLSDSCTTNFTANTTNICEGDTITFTPNCMPDTADYYWNFGIDATPSYAAGPGPHNVSYSWYGQFTVSLQVTSQGSTDTIIKTDYISVDSALHIDVASNSPVCTGDTIRLYEYSWESVNWSWNGPDGFTSTQKYPEIPNASNVHQGKYTVIATRANGCSNSDTINISVDTLPYVHAASNSPLCAGDTIRLHENGGEAVNWSWTGPDGFASSLEDPSITNVTEANDGQYTVVATNSNGCSNSDMIYVAVDSSAYVHAESNSPVCKGDSIYLQETGGEAVSWEWTGPGGFYSTSEYPAIANASVSKAGYYIVVGTNAGGCRNTDTVEVVVPSADFTYSADPANPLKYYFYDLSAGGSEISNWHWHFGDGSTSSNQNPVHTYDTSGTYQACLQIIANGCSDTICKFIDVSPGTDTIISGMIYAGGNPVETGTVQLFDASLDSAQVPVQTVSIDSGYYIFNHVAENDYKIRAIPGTGYMDDYENTYYGDELNWTDASIIELYDNLININIHLVAKDTNSCTPDFTANNTHPCEGDTITFTPNCMPDTADYYWNFGVDATPSYAAGPGPHNVSYSWYGQFTVSLQVTSQGSTDTIIKTDYISVDSALYINAASNSPVCTGDTIRLHENGGEAVNWSWTGPNGFASSLEDPSIANVTEANDGQYTVVATNSNGCSNSDMIYVAVDSSAYVHAESNSPVCKGDSIYLQETGGEAVSWEWTGPGGFYSTSEYPAIANASVSKAGYYIVVGTNAGGCRNTDTVEVVVPSADFTYSADPANPLKYYFYDLSAGGSEISNWHWHFGDGSTSSNQNPVHTYDTSGTYQACLQIIANGCSDTICKFIDVSPGTDTIISGMIYAGGNPVETGTVQLFDASLDSAQVPVQTVSIDSGYYIFNHVAENDYKIRAIPGTGYTNDYENTYYGDELYWTDAATVITNENKTGMDIHLIPKITECTADFNYSADSNNYFKYSFYDESVPVDDIISWFWDFNDGYMSSLQNPVHYFSDTGTYHVCLTMQTPYCKDTICKEIHIGLHTITGTVLTEFERVTHGTVQLFDAELDSAQAPIETVSIDSGAFIFNNVHPGNYKVRAIPGTEFSGNFIPTYYVNKVSWDNAYTIPVHTDIANVVIHLAEKAGTGTRDMQTTANKLLVYPNPAGKQLNLEINLQQSANMDIKIMNMTGQTVKTLNTTKPLGIHNISFDVSELKPGMYFGKTILNNEKQMIFRFIKK